MQYSIPVILDYDGKKHIASMGPFERSLERDFSLAVNKKAIEECSDIKKLKEVSLNLLQGWSNMQEAFQSMVKENLELRQAVSLQKGELQVAEQIIAEAAEMIERSAKPKDADSRYRKQSPQSKRGLWPW